MGHRCHFMDTNVQLIIHRTQRQIADSVTERSNCTDQAETPGSWTDRRQPFPYLLTNRESRYEMRVSDT
jgi:hypothetical protein